MLKRVLKSKWSLVIMLAAWLVLIWTRSFVGMANGCSTSAFEILMSSILTMVFTIIWGCNLFVWDDEINFFYEEEEASHLEAISSLGLQNSLCVVMAIAVVCLLSFAVTGWKEWLDLFSDSTYIKFGWFHINKKIIYDILAVIIFPVWTTFIIRKVKERGFITGAVCSGIMQILALTIIGFLLYMGRSKIWLIEMAVLNIITLILAVMGYAWKNIRKKGNAAALLILYGVLWIILLSISYHNGQSLVSFMGFSDTAQPTSYFINVNKIAENASFFGQSKPLLNDLHVIDFMKNSHYLLPSVLFYGGWLPAILLMAVEVVFPCCRSGCTYSGQRERW